MNIKNNFKRTLMIIMGVLFVLSFLVSQIYYKNENNKFDPRTIKARELYENYNKLTEKNNFSTILITLDSIDSIYNSIKHYSNSFEKGVVYNNKTATYLSMAIYFPDSSLSINGIDILTKDSLFKIAEEYAILSIQVYEKWLNSFENKNKAEITELIKNEFITGLETYPQKRQEDFLNKRVEEIETAKYETKRRLSVAYTNLGIIKRYQNNFEEAINLYNKALKLWDRNLTAENNINVLLGRPIKKRNLIEKIFPPEREEKTE